MALTRGLDPLLLEAVSSHFYPVLLVRIEWDTETIYAHSNTGDITWGGNTYTGVGSFGEVGVPEEDSSLVSSEATLSLRGGLLDLLEALDADVSGKEAFIYFGVTSEAGGTTLIGEPTAIFSGYIDGRDFSIGEGEGNFVHSLSLGLSTGPSARAKASVSHSIEDSKANFDGDTLMRHTLFIEKNLRNPKVWPAP